MLLIFSDNNCKKCVVKLRTPKKFLENVNFREKNFVDCSGGAGTRLPEYSTQTRLFLGHPNLTFPGRVDTRLYPKLTFSDFWVNFMQIFGYPKELPDFFGTRIRLSLLFRLPDPTRTRIFTALNIRYPTICYPLHQYLGL